MNFENPLEVSVNVNKPDRVKITFSETNYFGAYDNKITLDPDIQLDLTMPQQFPSKKEKVTLENTRKAITGVSIGSLILLILLQFLVGKIIKKMWSFFFAV